MKRLIVICAILMAGGSTYAQTTAPQDTSYWSNTLKGIFGINQSSFSNWQAGGENSFAWNIMTEGQANYRKGRTTWENRLKMGYGSVNQKSSGFRKNNDILVIDTKFGYNLVQSRPNLLWSTSANFLTQFTDGFNYPNDSVKISGFMAPGYLLIDTGIEWKKGKKFAVVYSPLASKMTFVNDDSLSNAGAYGVDPGENFRGEFGTSFKAQYVGDIAKNVNYTGNLTLFTDYTENFGNIDVYFSNLFVFKISDIFATTLSLDFIYDDDIDIQIFDDNDNLIGQGPRLQTKQVLSLGLTMNLASKNARTE